MKCIVCHGAEIRLKEVKEKIEVENNIVQVPLQVLVCCTCGERYYDRQTIRHLEEVDRELREGKAKLK